MTINEQLLAACERAVNWIDSYVETFGSAAADILRIKRLMKKMGIEP